MAFNFNISSLFGSLNSQNSIMNSFNFSDYASIKNGSYGKLMKSYYSDNKVSSSKTDTDKKPVNKPGKDKLTDNTGFSAMKKEADGLKTAADTLDKKVVWNKDSKDFDIDKISKAVKSFADEYNDVLKQASNMNSKNISESLYNMKSMTNTMSKALAKVGVNVDSEGKLSVNEDTLKKSDAKYIKSLFSGNASYGAQIESFAAKISSEAVRNSSFYTGNGSLKNSVNSMFESWM